MKFFRTLLVVSLALLILWACANTRSASGRDVTGRSPSPLARVPSRQGGPRSMRTPPTPKPSPTFVVELSDGQPADQKPPSIPSASTTMLDAAAVKQIENRLPAFAADVGQAQDFARPAESLPAPRTGVTEKQAFPPANELAAPAIPAEQQGPLRVLRHSPDGRVPLAPQVSLTFNKPMVAVTSQEQAAQSIPAILTPQPKGKWRWLGTKTLIFEPEATRLPNATDYTLEVPAKATSADGEVVHKSELYKFSTPPLEIVSSYPTGSGNKVSPVIVLTFNQAIEPKTLLSQLEVSANSTPVSCRIANSAEIKAETSAQNLVKELPVNTFICLKPTKDLPTDAHITVCIPKGATSAEGPVVTPADQKVSFQTYGPFKVDSYRCGWGNEPPSPGTPWEINFTNPIDEATLDPQTQIMVSPALPKMKVSVWRDQLTIIGNHKARTTYRVTLLPALRDVYGQNLESKTTVSFTMGSCRQALHCPGGTFNVIKNQKKPFYSVYSRNFASAQLQLYQVEPSDWSSWLTYCRDYKRLTPIPGRKVFDKSIRLSSVQDEYGETQIDLTPALTNGHGQVLLFLSARDSDGDLREYKAWMQVTSLGLTALSDSQNLQVLVTSLADGRPIAGAKVASLDGKVSATTDKTGLATLANPDQVSLLTAEYNGETAILPGDTYRNSGSYAGQTATARYSWFVFDDRGLYQPGEEYHCKGWVRLLTPGPTGDVQALSPTVRNLEWRLYDPRNNEIAQGSAALSPFGGFDFSTKLPDNINLGTANISLRLIEPEVSTAASFSHDFSVEQFRRPEFEVTTETNQSTHLIGQNSQVTATAAYYTGAALPAAPVNWLVTHSRASYSPPGWSEYTFGTWKPWWDCWMFTDNPSNEGSKSFEATTDSSGKNILDLKFAQVYPAEPTRVSVSASVTDVNRQTWSDTTSFLVHSATSYVGLKSERTFVQPHKPVQAELIVTDIDGQALADQKVDLRFYRYGMNESPTDLASHELDIQTITIKSAPKGSTVKFMPKEAGMHRLEATVTDSKGRINFSQITVWVAGSKLPTTTTIEQEKVLLVPDKQHYQPGDVAEIMVMPPFTPAQAVLTLQREGLVSTQSFSIDKPDYTLRIPIEDSYTPNLLVQIDLVGQQDCPEQASGKRPSYASGKLNLDIPPYQRTLKLDVSPAQTKLSPGGSTTLNLSLKDAQGQPVTNSEIAIVAVDEAVLSMINYSIDNPVSAFYPQRSGYVTDRHLRQYLLLTNPDIAEEQTQDYDENMVMADGAGGAPMLRSMCKSVPMPAMEEAAPCAAPEPKSGGAAIKIRRDFNPLAMFTAAASTDENGKATVQLRLPDNLTRYRITALAVDEAKQFGKGEANVVARLPLMVRPSAPRFLNFGDSFQLPVVIQNQTDVPLTVDTVVRTKNLELTQGAGRRLTVPANNRVEVLFPARTLASGEAAIQVGAVTPEYADAAEITLPVWTPATSEAFATYGQVDEGAIKQKVTMPEQVWPQFGGLEITTSSTALQELTDAVIYLDTYPFECAEQVASRMMALAALRDVLSAFNSPDLPDAASISKSISRDLDILRSCQDSSGGFKLWPSCKESLPYVSLHVANALVQCTNKGYNIDQRMLEWSLQYVKNIERHIPSYYALKTKYALRAYAVSILHESKKTDSQKALALYREGGIKELSLESLGWLLPTLAQSKDSGTAQAVTEILTHFNNRLTETAAAACFAESYSTDTYLLMHSDRRTDGVILDALIEVKPDSDVIPKLVRGLLSHRVRGRWRNTQENVFILLALDNYFNTYEKVDPNFVARIWLGQQYAGEHKFAGRSANYKQTEVPMKYLASQPTSDLIMSKEGPGRLYYRIGCRYAPKSLQSEAADYGFTVLRTYEAVDDPKDVQQDAQGTWRIKKGARVRSRLSMVASSRRYHVALVDPLPAGLEPLNSKFVNTQPIPPDKDSSNDEMRRCCWWWWPWYEHENLRNDRAEAFATLLWEGIHEYTYVSRATTPGTFVVPPAKAEEMYTPETFGRSHSDKVIIY